MADSAKRVVGAQPSPQKGIEQVIKPSTKDSVVEGVKELSLPGKNNSNGSLRKTTHEPKDKDGYINLYYTPGNSPRGKAAVQHNGYAFGSKTGPTSSESIVLPFLKESIYTDTILVVEGKKFYIHRSLLGYASDHFQKLFTVAHAVNAAGEKKTKPEVVIKDKTYNDFLELLAFFHPGVARDLTEKTAIRLLPIADEYDMQPLKKRCEIVLVNHLKKNSSFFSSNTKGPPTQRYRRDNAPEVLLKCTRAADKGNSKAVLDQCLKVFANPDIPLKDLKSSTDISDQIKAKVFETRVDTTSNKLTRVFGELEKEKHENTLLKKQLNDRFNVQKPGLRMSIASSADVHPIPSSVPLLHAHHYHTHHRQNIAKGEDQHKPPPSTKPNSFKH